MNLTHLSVVYLTELQWVYLSFSGQAAPNGKTGKALLPPFVVHVPPSPSHCAAPLHGATLSQRETRDGQHLNAKNSGAAFSPQSD